MTVATSPGSATFPNGRLLRTLSAQGQADDVTEFVRTNNLAPKLKLFRKASDLLQSDIPFDEIVGITTEELAALRNETDRKWTQPWMLYFVIAVCSVAAIEQGWAQTSMNGANLYFPNVFGIGTDSPRDTMIVGLINSGIYLSTGIFGAWLSGPLNNRLGRRGALLAGSLLCLVSNIASAYSHSWQELLLHRYILGFGLGINSSTAGVYAAECAPPMIRGGLAVSWQMFCAFGIFLGFTANVAVFNFGENAWRLQLAAPLSPIIPIIFMLYRCPESPAWHVKHNQRYDRAFESLRSLRNTELQAARELYASYIQRQAKGETDHKSTFWKRILELGTVPRIRRASVAAYAVMISQQLCGINIIAFYSSTIFSDAGFSTFGALIASCIFGFINFIGAFPAVWTMDTLGRRALLLLTLPFMAVTMFAAALTFNIPNESSLHLILLAFLVYLFCALYSPGMGPVPNTYAAEVFPLSHRETGMSMAVSTANIWASALSLTFPSLLTALHPQGVFSLYAVLNLVAVSLVFLFVPETRQKTLDELDEVFSIPTSRFINYQTKEYLPWLYVRYVLRQDRPEPSPLTASEDYHEVRQEEDDDGDEAS